MCRGKRGIYLLIFFFFMFLSLSVSSTTNAKTIKWRMQSFYPAAVKHGELLGKDFADLVRELSDGELDIQVFSAGEIVKGNEILDAVGRGVVQAGISVGSYWSGEIPLATLEYGLPYSFDNRTELNTYLYEKGFLDLLREVYAKKGCYYVGLAADNGFTLLTKKPIRTVEDLKKMKLRATGATGDLLSELGASMVSLAGTELYTALSTGVVDGCVYGGFETQWRLGNHEVTKYIMMPKIMPVHGPNTFLVNLKAWNELSDKLKKIVTTAWQQRSEPYFRYKYNGDLEYLRKMQEYGLEVIWLPEKEQQKMRTAAQKVWEKVASKDENTKKAVDILKKYLEFLGR